MPTIITKGARFLARVRQAGFSPVAKTFNTKRDALAWGRRIEEDMRAGRYQEVKTAVPTVKAALQTYSMSVLAKTKGAATYAYWVDELAGSVLARLTVDAVTPADLAAWRDEQALTRSAGTVARKLGLLSGFFTWAMKERGWIEANPLRRVRKPVVRDSRDRVLSDDERAYLLAGAGAGRGGWLGDALTALLWSAMRRSELWSLRVRDVDADRSVATLSDSKNGDARLVPLCSEAIAALTRLANRAQATAAIERSQGRPAPAQGEERLVPVMKAPAISLAFRRALARGKGLYLAHCKAQGVEPDTVFLEGVRLHDLRHCAVSTWAATGGLSLPELQAISGHRTVKMLLRYVALSPDALAAKMARIGASSASEALA